MRTSALIILACTVTAFFTRDLRAQQPSEGVAEPDVYQIGSTSVKPTPEMWLYVQEKQRADDPKLALRRKAERKAEERRRRIAATKWYGLSRLRPQVNPTPVLGTYAPRWYGSWLDPHRWVASRGSTVVITPATQTRVISD